MSPDPKSSQSNPLGFDEFISILVAFATIGVILFWSFSRREDSGWNMIGLQSPLPTISTSPSSSIPPERLVPRSHEPAKTPLVPYKAIPEDELPPVSQIGPKASPQASLLIAPEIYTIEEYRAVTPAEKLPTIPPPIAFTDIPSDFWGRRFIDKLSSRGIIKGFPDYSFRPNQPVSRAEFAAMLQQSFNTKVRSKGLSFEDVSENYWAAPAIDQAISAGFLKGYPDNTFKPQQKISRVQVLVALASGLNLKESSPSNQVLSIYEDVGDIPQYAIAKVTAATENSIVVNYPDAKFLAPNKEATRAEVAAMIHQALVRTGRLQPIKSQNVVSLP
ncbi:S-layer protein [Scytonema sp. UIC 10036]|uniref:S-layer homology domain-containing protein n=1 Tax=Scytonema sp. UIC 10036 TaxID=2304196 RepID=UPI0012DA9456|nr:S-layer homology domain-containing protein [Scytonema sp. UIC 10036]MUG99089.1 S-layer protein [Scytonema sp. UIC 10036]